LEEQIDELILLPHPGEEILAFTERGNEHSSTSREVQDEGGRETARSSILGKRGKVGRGVKTEED
jgi:hypothetical protein